MRERKKTTVGSAIIFDLYEIPTHLNCHNGVFLSRAESNYLQKFIEVI